MTNYGKFKKFDRDGWTSWLMYNCGPRTGKDCKHCVLWKIMGYNKPMDCRDLPKTCLIKVYDWLGKETK